MAQLSDDCFAFGGALLGIDAALALIEERVTPVVEAELVPLADAAAIADFILDRAGAGPWRS